VHQDRVAIGRGALDLAGGDVAAGTGLVLDHEIAAGHLAEFECHHAGDHIGKCTGAKAHDDVDGFGFGPIGLG
jgi:hypothetical protein